MKSMYYICGMKNIIVTLMLLTLNIGGYSQVLTVYVDDLTRFAIPEGLTLYDSHDLLIQEQDNYGNEIDRHWGGDNAHYVFDFNEMKMYFTSKSPDEGWKSFEFDIIEVYDEPTVSDFACIVDYGTLGESFFCVTETLDDEDGIADIFYSYHFITTSPTFWTPKQEIDWDKYNLLIATKKPLVLYDE